MLYEFVVDDPSTWVKPWTDQMTMTATQGPIYEYACHEGNYGLTGILAGGRSADRVKAAAGK